MWTLGVNQIHSWKKDSTKQSMVTRTRSTDHEQKDFDQAKENFEEKETTRVKKKSFEQGMQPTHQPTKEISLNHLDR